MIISKLKENKVYLSFNELYQTDRSEIRGKLTDIINIFKTKELNLYVKLSFSSKEIMDCIEGVLGVKDATIIEHKSKFKAYQIAFFSLEKSKMKLLVELSKYDDAMVELFFLKEGTMSENFNIELISEAYICISDNDGPCVIFSEKFYGQDTLLKIREILNQK